MREVARLKRQARWSRATLEAHQRAHLVRLFEHARTRSSYWRRTLSEGSTDLRDAPPLDKRTLLAHFDEMVTDPAVTFAEAERFVLDPARAEGLALFRNRYAVRFTAGSSGLRGVGVSDRDVAALNVAILAARLHVPNPPRLRRPRVLTLGAATTRYGSGFNARFMSKAMSSQQAVAADAPIAEIVDVISQFRPDIVTGYPSALARLPPERTSGRLAVSPRVFVGGGEVFPASTRAALREAFGCAVTSTYGTTECGQVAIECAYERLHVNEDVVVLEVVDGDMRPVAEGDTGEAVLVTHLFNRVLPMIRYRFDDRVRMGLGRCPCGSGLRWIEAIEGRSSAATYFELPGRGGQKAGVVGWKLHLAMINLVEVAGAQVVHTPPAALRIDVVPQSPDLAERAVGEARRRALELIEQLGADLAQVDLTVGAVPELTMLDSKKTFNFRIDRRAG